MNPRISALFIGLITLACFVAGALIYPNLPAIVVAHWNAAGQPNGFSPRFWGVFTFPLIILVLALIWAVLPEIDPINRGFKGFRHVYDFAWILLIAFLAYAYALTLEKILGFSFDVFQALLPAFALLFLCIGGLLPHVKRNWFFGIRTPWTLSSEKVWDKTHRLGSPLFMLAGLLVLAGVFYPALALWFLLAPILTAVLIAAVYSYVLFRRER